MLHADSDKRIAEVNDISNLFAQKDYPKTSQEIREFSAILRGEKIPADFLKRLDHLLDTYMVEFRDLAPVGKDYREKCFEEIKGLIIQAMGRMGADFGVAYMQVYPIAVSLKQGRFNLANIGEEITKNGKTSNKGKFYSYSFLYVILVEGVFDEVARILYFLKTVTKTNRPTTQDLMNLKVNDIYHALTPKPAFLDGWERKRRIRNAIAHASFTYDETKDEIHFVDKGRTTFEETIPLDKFIVLALELEACVEAYAMITVLLRLLDLIQSPNVY